MEEEYVPEQDRRPVELYCRECTAQLTETENSLLYRCEPCDKLVHYSDAMTPTTASDRIDEIVQEVKRAMGDR